MMESEWIAIPCRNCTDRVDCLMNKICKQKIRDEVNEKLKSPQTEDEAYKELGQRFDKVEFPDGKGYTRHGSPTFYALLTEMADIHSAKSHDYASQDNPYGNYLFAGQLSKLFNSPEDSGFIGRVGEKLYRLANLENGGKIPSNESVEDTERDIATIIALWIAMRRDRRNK